MVLQVKNNELTLEQVFKHCESITAEHKSLPLVPVKSGDWVIWNNRLAHGNSDENQSNRLRHVMYHGFLLGLDSVNGQLMKQLQENRKTLAHPPDFPKRLSMIESNDENKSKLLILNELGRLLYGYEQVQDNSPNNHHHQFKDLLLQQEIEKGKKLFTERHLRFFNRYGYVVIENAVNASAIEKLKVSTSQFLKQNDIELDIMQPEKPQPVLKKKWAKVCCYFFLQLFVSIKNNTLLFNLKKKQQVAYPMGGMIETFWLPEMDCIRQDPIVYGIMVKFTELTWQTCKGLYEHPFGKINAHSLWLYIDRQNVRFPNNWYKNMNQDK